jgi:pentatricopeptide repeat protein
MKGAGYLPDQITLTTVMNSAATSGDIRSAERIFKELTSDNFPVKPDAIVFTTLLKAIGM